MTQIYLDYPIPNVVVKGEVRESPSGLPGKGEVPAEYAIVGQSPSTRRAPGRELEPFGAKSYKILAGLLDMYPDIYVTNLVKEPFRPGKKPGVTTIRLWAPRLFDELRLVSPRRILTLGDIAARALCGDHFSGLREDRGTFFWNRELDAWVVPTYHFSAGARNPHLNRFINRDLQRFYTLADPDLSSVRYEVCPEDTDRYLGRILRQCPEGAEVILDVETTGLGLDAALTQVGITWEDGPVFLFLAPTPGVMIQLGEIFKRKHVTLVGHNLQFDWGVLLRTTNWKWPRMGAHDTMLLGHIKGEEVLALKHLVTLYTDRPGSRTGGSPGDPLYLAEDVIGTSEVFRLFREHASAPIYPVLQDLVPLVASIKVRGVHIDRDRLQTIRDETADRVVAARAVLDELSGDPSINWNSTHQVPPVLVRLGVPLFERTDSGNLSVAEKYLLPLREAHPIVDALLKYREEEKQLSGFCEGWLKASASDSRLHPTLLLTGTETGRLACRDPNLQQVKREGPLKEIFVPEEPEGSYGIVDLDQAELRVAALLSGDEGLLQALLESDPHRFIASIVFKKPEAEVSATERKASKKTTFGVLYGGSAYGLAQKAGLEVDMVQYVIDMLRKEFKVLFKWMDVKQREAIASGFIPTIFGRNRPVKEHLARGNDSQVRRLAVNTPIQSVASDSMLVVIRGTDRRLRKARLASRVLFGVHDSALTSVGPGEAEAVARAVQSAFLDLQSTPIGKLPGFDRLPLTGSFMTGPSWAAVESTNAAYAPVASWQCSSTATGFAPAVFLTKEEPEDFEEDEREYSEDYDDIAAD